MRQAVIVECARSAFGKLGGSLKDTRPEDLCAQVVKGVLEGLPTCVSEDIEDLVLGCAFPEGQQGANLARNVVGLAGLPVTVAAQTINRYCSSGLQAIVTAANAIISGQQCVVLAGGVESMSTIPMGGARKLPNPTLIETNPEYYISMGLTAENVAKKYSVTRERMDAFAVSSHDKAKKAQEDGKFSSEILSVQASRMGKNGIETFTFDKDESIRPQTTLESLSKLRPVFRHEGVVTAGNSSQMTDGAAMLLLVDSEYAEKNGLKPLARFVSYTVAGVEPDLMGIGPIKAIPKALELAGLTLSDIDMIELNEAFAAQALACIDTLDMDLGKVNVFGGAIALGHPLGCTGAALTVRVVRELQRRKGRYGLVTMCIGGGQGAAGVFECL
jgi:acetyl-CoA acyltransferase